LRPDTLTKLTDPGSIAAAAFRRGTYLMTGFARGIDPPIPEIRLRHFIPSASCAGGAGDRA